MQKYKMKDGYKFTQVATQSPRSLAKRVKMLKDFRSIFNSPDIPKALIPQYRDEFSTLAWKKLTHVESLYGTSE